MGVSWLKHAPPLRAVVSANVVPDLLRLRGVLGTGLIGLICFIKWVWD